MALTDRVISDNTVLSRESPKLLKSDTLFQVKQFDSNTLQFSLFREIR